MEREQMDRVAEELPPGELEEEYSEEAARLSLIDRIINPEVKERAKKLDTDELLDHSFSREDILGNITRWEVYKVMALHQLEKACNDMKLEDAAQFFLKEAKKILMVSRSVGGMQQKILRTTLTGRIEPEKKEFLGVDWSSWK